MAILRKNIKFILSNIGTCRLNSIGKKKLFADYADMMKTEKLNKQTKTATTTKWRMGQCFSTSNT